MRLRRLTVSNFRGIRRCEWRIDQALVALIGPGDATKTTLLDAVGAVLHPNYTLPLSDADFYRGDITAPITIEVVITGMPPELLTESQLGPDCSGLTPDDEVIHDPIDSAEPCLVIRLSVGEDLEPSWTVVRPGAEGAEDTRPISASQRRALGFFRLGERANTHLRWSRVSALSSFTANKAGEQAVLAAQRSAREAVFNHESPDLAGVTAEVAEAAIDYGSAHFTALRPGLEPDTATSANALILHDDRVPLTGYGLGSRRLTSLAIQPGPCPGVL
jgi:putative ATP-dependent endonuclease of OLD family